MVAQGGLGCSDPRQCFGLGKPPANEMKLGGPPARLSNSRTGEGR
jgi:hypothetical protein